MGGLCDKCNGKRLGFEIIADGKGGVLCEHCHAEKSRSSILTELIEKQPLEFLKSQPIIYWFRERGFSTLYSLWFFVVFTMEGAIEKDDELLIYNIEGKIIYKYDSFLIEEIYKKWRESDISKKILKNIAVGLGKRYE